MYHYPDPPQVPFTRPLSRSMVYFCPFQGRLHNYDRIECFTASMKYIVPNIYTSFLVPICWSMNSPRRFTSSWTWSKTRILDNQQKNAGKDNLAYSPNIQQLHIKGLKTCDLPRFYIFNKYRNIQTRLRCSTVTKPIIQQSFLIELFHGMLQ